MENIGVLTHCVADNYGANLQAYSTALYLKNSGFNPIFIKWMPYPTNGNKEQVKLHMTFLERNGIVVTENCETDDDFVACIKRYNMHHIIVGSDCVFTYAKQSLIPYRITRKGIKKIEILPDWKFPNPFYIPFYHRIPNVKLAIMSGSCGCSDLEHASARDKRKMNELLNNFSYISVRDEYTKLSLEGILGKDKISKLEITPDPVFAFNQNLKSTVKKQEILKKFDIPDNYITMGFYEGCMPADNWLVEFKNCINKNGYKLVNLPMPQAKKDYVADINIHLPLDTIDWYYLIKYSNGYIGNNMHPIIVSMHNSIPFLSINAHGKFSRWKKSQDTTRTKEVELLRRFGLLKYHIPISQINTMRPEKAVEFLFNFDKNYCSECANKLKSEYFDMMDNIINEIGLSNKRE